MRSRGNTPFDNGALGDGITHGGDIDGNLCVGEGCGVYGTDGGLDY